MPGFGQRPLPPPTGERYPTQFSLSPDGRYVGWAHLVDRHFHLRDLVTGSGRDIGSRDGNLPSRALAWSPNSRWLLLHGYTEAIELTPEGAREKLNYVLVEMGGGVRKVPGTVVDPGEAVVGLLNSGDLLLMPATAPGVLPVLRVISPATGEELRRVQVTFPPGSPRQPGPNERIVGTLVKPCSCAVELVVAGPGGRDRPTALLAVDLGDGHVSGYADLPASTGPSDDLPVWSVRASLPGGIMLVHRYPAATDIEALNDVTGDREVIARLPARSEVVVRGQPG